MTELKIEIDNGRTSFRSGERIAGSLTWRLNDAPKSLVLRLFWHTAGRGTQDVKVVEQVVFDNPVMAGSKPFSLQLPSGPYSFSGKLISLIWSLELIVEPAGAVDRVDLVVSSSGMEVQLTGNAMDD